VALRPPRGQNLDRQTALTQALLAAEPVYDAVDWSGEGGVHRATAFVEQALEAPVKLWSSGPSAADVVGIGGCGLGKPFAGRC
jgi:hypothetical protein